MHTEFVFMDLLDKCWYDQPQTFRMIFLSPDQIDNCAEMRILAQFFQAYFPTRIIEEYRTEHGIRLDRIYLWKQNRYDRLINFTVYPYIPNDTLWIMQKTNISFKFHSDNCFFIIVRKPNTHPTLYLTTHLFDLGINAIILKYPNRDRYYYYITRHQRISFHFPESTEDILASILQPSTILRYLQHLGFKYLNTIPSINDLPTLDPLPPVIASHPYLAKYGDFLLNTIDSETEVWQQLNHRIDQIRFIAINEQNHILL